MIYKIKGHTVAYIIDGLDKGDLYGLLQNTYRFQKTVNEVVHITKWLTENNIKDFQIFIGAILEPIIQKSYIEIEFKNKDDLTYFVTGF